MHSQAPEAVKLLVLAIIPERGRLEPCREVERLFSQGKTISERFAKKRPKSVACISQVSEQGASRKNRFIGSDFTQFHPATHPLVHNMLADGLSQ